MVYLLLMAGVIADLVGNFTSKQYVEVSHWGWLVGTFAAFMLSSALWILFLRYGQLSVMAPIWSVVVLVGAIVIGILCFKETLSPLQIAGIIFCIVGVALLQWPHKV